MDTAATALLERLTSRGDSPADLARMRHNIRYVNRLDERFSNIALKLIGTKESQAEATALSMLRIWMQDAENVPAAYNNIKGFGGKIRTYYNEARYILEEAIREKSVIGVEDMTDDLREKRTLGRECLAGDKLILSSELSVRPDLLEASEDEINRYYHSLAVASVIIRPSKDGDRFLLEVPDFITWAAAQEDMNQALVSAWRTRSLNPSAIAAMTAMLDETAVPLHGGIL